MSNQERRKFVKQLETKEIDYFALPAGHKPSAAERIIHWIVSGDASDKEAMFDLFPLPGNVRREITPNT